MKINTPNIIKKEEMLAQVEEKDIVDGFRKSFWMGVLAGLLICVAGVAFPWFIYIILNHSPVNYASDDHLFSTIVMNRAGVYNCYQKECVLLDTSSVIRSCHCGNNLNIWIDGRSVFHYHGINGSTLSFNDLIK
jgi:hypothetical protein